MILKGRGGGEKGKLQYRSLYYTAKRKSMAQESNGEVESEYRGNSQMGEKGELDACHPTEDETVLRANDQFVMVRLDLT